jgi:hypothetical protein
MTAARFALGLLALLCGLGTLYLGTTDVHYRDRNCGTAVFATDPTDLSVQSGDPATDDFEQDSLITNCNHLISQRRFFTLLPAIGFVVAIVAGRTLRDRPERMRGSIFGADPKT